MTEIIVDRPYKLFILLCLMGLSTFFIYRSTKISNLWKIIAIFCLFAGIQSPISRSYGGTERVLLNKSFFKSAEKQLDMWGSLYDKSHR